MIFIIFSLFFMATAPCLGAEYKMDPGSEDQRVQRTPPAKKQSCLLVATLRDMLVYPLADRADDWGDDLAAKADMVISTFVAKAKENLRHGVSREVRMALLAKIEKLSRFRFGILDEALLFDGVDRVLTHDAEADRLIQSALGNFCASKSTLAQQRIWGILNRNWLLSPHLTYLDHCLPRLARSKDVVLRRGVLAFIEEIMDKDVYRGVEIVWKMLSIKYGDPEHSLVTKELSTDIALSPKLIKHISNTFVNGERDNHLSGDAPHTKATLSAGRALTIIETLLNFVDSSNLAAVAAVARMLPQAPGL